MKCKTWFSNSNWKMTARIWLTIKRKHLKFVLFKLICPSLCACGYPEFHTGKGYLYGRKHDDIHCQPPSESARCLAVSILQYVSHRPELSMQQAKLQVPISIHSFGSETVQHWVRMITRQQSFLKEGVSSPHVSFSTDFLQEEQQLFWSNQPPSQCTVNASCYKTYSGINSK